MSWPGGFGRTSLRGRLVGSMSAVVLAGLAGVATLHEMAEGRRGVGRGIGRALLGDGMPEPFQDLAVLLPFGIATLGLVWVVTVWSLAPVRAASEEAARAGPGDPRARIGTDRLPLELTPLVRAMNGALDRLQVAYEAERRFTQNAAHELRTPLAALDLRLQRARRTGEPDWPQIERDLAQMGRLVGQLLELARKEAAATADAGFGPVNLARVAREAASQVLPLVERAGRVLEVELPDVVAIDGRADDLRDLLRNLLENALHHGAGRILLRIEQDARRVRADVSDEGGGVPAALSDALFERFRKGGAGPGSGLGLAIARTVAERHGGRVGFVPGPGCLVRVVLPRPGAPPPARTGAAVPRRVA